MYRGRGRIFGGKRNERLVPPLAPEFRGTLFHPRINEGILERKEDEKGWNAVDNTLCRINQRCCLNIHMSAHWRNLSDRLSENPGFSEFYQQNFQRNLDVSIIFTDERIGIFSWFNEESITRQR